MKEPDANRQLASDEVEERLVVGVDGGGTKTAACLARCTVEGNFQIIGRGNAGSANVAAVGLANAASNIEAALDSAWAEAGVDSRPVDAAALALAGAGLESVQSQIKQWAAHCRLSTHLQIVHDAEAVLAAGVRDGWGVALISGTGSVAMGRNPDGRCEVAGGWGFWFGDEGSAFAIGQAALRAVAQAADGRGPATQLTTALCSLLQLDDPRGLLTALAERGDVRLMIAELASEVTRAASESDSVAAAIVQQTSKDLAALVVSTASKLSLGREFPLALAGGALCGSETLRIGLLEQLSEAALQPTTIQLVNEPVLGCLKLACDQLAQTD